MLSLPPSLAPRSVPLTQVPPPRRAGRSALVAGIAAWAILGFVIVFRMELGDDFSSAEAWRSVVRRALLGLSGVLALASFVPALSGVRRAALESIVALVLGCAWLATVAFALFAR
jgi:hypothetical protein